MAGFNLDPQLLAQMAQAAFRPPQAHAAPGINLQPPQQSGGGFGMGDGMAMAGMGLGALKGMGGGNIFDAAGRTAGDADLGGHGSSPVDPMGGNPNAQPVEMFNPTGAVKSVDPLTNMVTWIGRQFRPGGAGA